MEVKFFFAIDRDGELHLIEHEDGYIFTRQSTRGANCLSKPRKLSLDVQTIKYNFKWLKT